MKNSNSIQEFRFDGSGNSYGMICHIPPYGDGHIFAPDVSKASKQLLKDIETKWNELWPEILHTVQQLALDHDRELNFDSSTFYASVQRLKAGEFMADQADLMISIHPSMNAVKKWDLFMTGARIVHSQPVF